MTKWTIPDTPEVASLREENARLRAALASQAAVDVLTERQRQQTDEGWTHQHDDQWRNGELPRAARAYVLAAHVPNTVRDMFLHMAPSHWPWRKEWWRPTTRRRDLVKAGALILAEIERLDRAALSGSAPGEGE